MAGAEKMVAKTQLTMEAALSDPKAVFDRVMDYLLGPGYLGTLQSSSSK